MSRLRRLAGSLLLSGPYRLASGLATEVRGDRASALPRSSAPVVRRWRTGA
jgi:hypothetical protein